MENEHLRVRFNAAGLITSLYDKRHNREVLTPGTRGNQLQLFEDKPVNFDAWDIDAFYADKPPEVLRASSVRVTATGSLKAALEMTYQTPCGSTIRQEVALYHDQPLVFFHTWVDWQEEHKLLKCAFPVAINARRASYEIQFGHIERPTHGNTLWDRARFEVPAHRWADLSEGDYGVSLLNDCKYGYDIKDGLMRLTLLRAPTDPDPSADRGQHEFTYALYPHRGDLRQAQVVRRGYELNAPLSALFLPAGQAGRLDPTHSFFRLANEHVILETVKLAEDGEGLVVRLYEAANTRGPATLRFGFPVRQAIECDCLERAQRPVPVNENSLTFSVAPFEIKTFKLLTGQG